METFYWDSSYCSSLSLSYMLVRAESQSVICSRQIVARGKDENQIHMQFIVDYSVKERCSKVYRQVIRGLLSEYAILGYYPRLSRWCLPSGWQSQGTRLSQLANLCRVSVQQCNQDLPLILVDCWIPQVHNGTMAFRISGEYILFYNHFPVRPANNSQFISVSYGQYRVCLLACVPDGLSTQLD